MVESAAAPGSPKEEKKTEVEYPDENAPKDAVSTRQKSDAEGTPRRTMPHSEKRFYEYRFLDFTNFQRAE